ncbi:MAG TPA: 3-oxoacyl-ACP reductase [Solirubrobacteraceae bacterium]
MPDLYSQIVNAPIGSALADTLGLPRPVELDRHHDGDPVVRGPVLLGAAPGSRLAGPLARVLAGAGAEVLTALEEPVRSAAADAGVDAGVFNGEAPGEHRFKALVFDATGIEDASQLVELQRFFYPTVGRVLPSGRVLVLATTPEQAGGVRAQTAQRAIEGFTRSLGKEIGRGATVNLVHVAPGAEDALASTVRFFLSPRSAYVSGQSVEVAGAAVLPPGLDWDAPLRGKTALVTGASRGIGAAIATTLAGQGATVVGLDVEPLAGELRAAMDALGGEAIVLDITDADAPATLAARFGGGRLDVLVHNAGVTRDRTLAKMPADRWQSVLSINLISEERIDDALLDADAFAEGGRIVCVSSMSGIAGNAGQTNYATSKAGVIGMVEAMAPVVEARGMTINGVAPGFIETAMTGAMPVGVREAGRRLSSLRQGGLPVDVAETIAWLAHPASGGVNGQVVRVCGQSLIGA